MLSPRVRTGIVMGVSILWGASTARNLIDPGYTPDPSLNAAFALVLGIAFGLGKKTEDKDDDDTEHRKDRR